VIRDRCCRSIGRPGSRAATPAVVPVIHRGGAGGNITIVSRDDPRRGRTDWAAADALSDAEINEAVRGDPDAVPLEFDWSETVLVEPPKKKTISIRVDEDVLDYFKRGGAGYQRRMNRVLRFYMRERQKKKA
jgi:uncharacterized protein (DUF4415 family)